MRAWSGDGMMLGSTFNAILVLYPLHKINGDLKNGVEDCQGLPEATIDNIQTTYVRFAGLDQSKWSAGYMEG